MPRKTQKMMRVKQFEELDEKSWQTCRIVKIDCLPRDRGIKFTLEHTDPTQEGRSHVGQLPVPRPAGRTHDLLTAAGLKVIADTEIDLADAEGAIIDVRLRRLANGSYEPIAFRPVHQTTGGDEGRGQPFPS